MIQIVPEKKKGNIFRHSPILNQVREEAYLFFFFAAFFGAFLVALFFMLFPPILLDSSCAPSTTCSGNSRS
jgi:hypothetical protein